MRTRELFMWITEYQLYYLESEDIEPMIQKLILHLHFTKSFNSIVFTTPRRTYLHSINTLACSKAEI